MSRFKILGVVLVILLCLYGIVAGCKADSDTNSNTDSNTDINTDEATVKSIRLLYSGGVITGDSLTEGLSAATMNKFTANVQVTGGASKSFTLESSNPVVASVSGKTVTLAAAGQTILTATAAGDTSKKHAVTLYVVDDTPPAYPAPYYITNNFGEDASSEFLAQWHNDSNVTAQKLQIVPETGDFANAIEITAEGEAFQTSGSKGIYALRDVFRVHITGLNPNTRYKYRMGNWGKWSDTFYHLTSGGHNTDFSFTVITDPQSSTSADMAEALRAANEFDADNRFFLNCGDLVEQIGYSPNEIVYYTNVSNEFNRYKPIVATQGNHDTYDTSMSYNFVYDEATVFNAFVTFPDNGCQPDKTKSQSYYFYYNKVLFIVLSTTVSNTQHTVQAEWLKNILKNDRDNELSKFRIVITHVGPLGNHYYEDYHVKLTRSTYGKIFSDYDVDIVFYGHDHTYGRTKPMKFGTNTELSALDFGPTPNGTIYSIAGSPGPKFYGKETGSTADDYFQKLTNTTAEISPGIYVNVKVTGEKLSVTAKYKDGRMLDIYEVERKN
jgi:predicted phosphodiesterase